MLTFSDFLLYMCTFIISFTNQVKEYLDKQRYDLCQQKLTDFNLSKHPGFVWCINQVICVLHTSYTIQDYYFLTSNIS